MSRPIIIICIDGFDPDYLEAAEMPNLREIGRKGFMTTGRSMMPSVTNVNNVSIVTASYPAEHGICSNYRWDRETGEGILHGVGREHPLPDDVPARRTNLE